MLQRMLKRHVALGCRDTGSVSPGRSSQKLPACLPPPRQSRTLRLRITSDVLDAVFHESSMCTPHLPASQIDTSSKCISMPSAMALRYLDSRTDLQMLLGLRYGVVRALFPALHALDSISSAACSKVVIRESPRETSGIQSHRAALTTHVAVRSGPSIRAAQAAPEPASHAHFVTIV